MWLTRLRQRKEVEVHGKGKNSRGKGVHCYRAIHAARAPGVLGITTHTLDGGIDRVTF